MMTLPAYLRSLLLASALGFAAPVFLVGALLVSLYAVGQIPLVSVVGQSGTAHILEFLIVFGNGDVLEGILIIGSTCALVGALFDTYAFYQQNLKGG